MSIFKDFKINIVVNTVYRYKVDSLTPLPLTFINLLTYICHTVYIAGGRGFIRSIKAVSGSVTVYRRVRGFYKGF